MADNFDPDAYLAEEPTKKTTSGFNPDEYLAEKSTEEPEKDSTLLEKGNAALRAGTQGLVSGYADEVGGAIGGVVDTGLDAAQWVADKTGADVDLKKYKANPEASGLDNYRSNRDLLRKSDKEAEEAAPNIYTGAEVAGAILSPTNKLLPGGGSAKALAKSGAIAGGAATLGASEADLTKPSLENYGEAALDTAKGATLGSVGAVAVGKGLNRIADVASSPVNSVKEGFFNLKDKARKLLNKTTTVDGPGERDFTFLTSPAGKEQRARMLQQTNFNNKQAGEALDELTSHVADRHESITVDGLKDTYKLAKDQIRSVGQTRDEFLSGLKEPSQFHVQPILKDAENISTALRDFESAKLPAKRIETLTQDYIKNVSNDGQTLGTDLKYVLKLRQNLDKMYSKFEGTPEGNYILSLRQKVDENIAAVESKMVSGTDGEPLGAILKDFDNQMTKGYSARETIREALMKKKQKVTAKGNVRKGSVPSVNKLRAQVSDTGVKELSTATSNLNSNSSLPDDLQKYESVLSAKPGAQRIEALSKADPALAPDLNQKFQDVEQLGRLADSKATNVADLVPSEGLKRLVGGGRNPLDQVRAQAANEKRLTTISKAIEDKYKNSKAASWLKIILKDPSKPISIGTVRSIALQSGESPDKLENDIKELGIQINP